MIKQIVLEPTHDKNNNFNTPFIYLSGLNSKYFLILLLIIQKYFLCNLLNEIVHSSNLLYSNILNYYINLLRRLIKKKVSVQYVMFIKTFFLNN